MYYWFKAKKAKIEGLLNGRTAKEVNEQEIFAYWDVSEERSKGASEINGLNPFEERPECLSLGVVLSIAKFLSPADLRALRATNRPWHKTLELAKGVLGQLVRSERTYLAALLNTSKKRRREEEPFVANKKMKPMEPVDAYCVLPAEIWDLIFHFRTEIMARECLAPALELVCDFKETLKTFFAHGIPSYTLGDSREIRKGQVEVMAQPANQLWLDEGAKDGPLVKELRRGESQTFYMQSLCNVFRCNIPDHLETDLRREYVDSSQGLPAITRETSEPVNWAAPEILLAAETMRQVHAEHCDYDPERNAAEFYACSNLKGYPNPAIDWQNDGHRDPTLFLEEVDCTFCRSNLGWLAGLDWVIAMLREEPVFILRHLGVNGLWPGWLYSSDFQHCLEDREFYAERQPPGRLQEYVAHWPAAQAERLGTFAPYIKGLEKPKQDELNPIDPVWQPVLALATLLDIAFCYSLPDEPEYEVGYGKETNIPRYFNFNARTEGRGHSYLMASIYDSPFLHFGKIEQAKGRLLTTGGNVCRHWYYTPEDAETIPERVKVQVNGVDCPTKFMQRTFGVPENEFDNFQPETYGTHCAASVRMHAVDTPFGWNYPTFSSIGNSSSRRAHTWFFTDLPGRTGLLCPFQEAHWSLNNHNNPLFRIANTAFSSLHENYADLSPVQRIRLVSGEHTTPMQPIVCPGNCRSAGCPEELLLPSRFEEDFEVYGSHRDDYLTVKSKGLMNDYRYVYPYASKCLNPTPVDFNTNLNYPLPAPDRTFNYFTNNPKLWTRQNSEFYSEHQFQSLVGEVGQEHSVYIYNSASLRQSFAATDERSFMPHEAFICENRALHCPYRKAQVYETDEMLDENLAFYFKTEAAKKGPLLFPDRLAHHCPAFSKVRRSLVPSPVPPNVRYLPSQLPLAAALFHAYDRRKAKAVVDEIDHSLLFETVELSTAIAAEAEKEGVKRMLSWHDQFLIAYRRNPLHTTVKELHLDVPHFAAFWDNYRFFLQARPQTLKLMTKIYAGEQLSPNFNKNLVHDPTGEELAPLIIPPECWKLNLSVSENWLEQLEVAWGAPIWTDVYNDCNFLHNV